jgi:RNA polymerase sigma-70 factor (ECF subfamily)
MVWIPQREMVSEEWAVSEAHILLQTRTNPAAFAPLYEHYFARVYGYCLRRIGQPEEAEDVTSQIFTRVLGNLSSYRGGSFAAWLFRIAHNTVLNYLRDRRPRISLDSMEILPEDLARHGDKALERLVQSEERRHIAKLIAALPEDQRELLALRIVGELSAKEVGAVLGKSEGAVRVALHRIVRQLRQSYQQTEEL